MGTRSAVRLRSGIVVTCCILIAAAILLPVMRRWPAGGERQAPPAPAGESRERLNPLLLEARTVLQRRNPRISRVVISDLEAFAPGEGHYVMICEGWVKDRTFRGDFADELFGFFIVDTTLTRIIKTVDIVRTPRWGDYRYSITKMTGDFIVITGRGETYGDGPVTRKYRWNPYEDDTIADPRPHR